jgi:hypothetical protein
MKSILVTQSFGRENEYKRAIFLIWSYWANRDEKREVILFTDNPAYFSKYFVDRQVRYILLTPEKIKLMRGEIDFLHRMKISLIEEAFAIYPAHNLLYADSDAFFISSPNGFLNQLSPSVSFMHLKEYIFESLRTMPLPAGIPFHAFLELIDQKQFILPDGSFLKIGTEMASWNAGIMMFHSSHVGLLKEVYLLTDQFYPHTHNHASEQYAFSVVLQTKTELKNCQDMIYHYWYRVKKRIADSFFDTEILRLLNLCEEKRMKKMRLHASQFPSYLENHVWLLQDHALQAFHENQFRQGYTFAARALLKNPFSISFIREVAYHTKRLFINK